MLQPAPAEVALRQNAEYSQALNDVFVHLPLRCQLPVLWLILFREQRALEELEGMNLAPAEGRCQDNTGPLVGDQRLLGITRLPAALGVGLLFWALHQALGRIHEYYLMLHIVPNQRLLARQVEAV